MQTLSSRLLIVLAVTALAVGGFVIFGDSSGDSSSPVDSAKSPVDSARPDQPQPLLQGNIVNWWGFLPQEIKVGLLNPASSSNIMRNDYSGAESCRKCHKRNYEGWSHHPHRWMNAMANPSTVRGDFSGKASLSYRGGTAHFYKADDEYRMRLERDNIERVYRVSQTIGSRFYQYYVGTLVTGPEPKESQRYTVDHVLPFGYWLEENTWVPTVHVHWVDVNGVQVDEEDVPSEQRPDPFAAPGDLFSFTEYFRCNKCHTTFPLGDLLVRDADTLGRHLMTPLHLDSFGYLQEAHTDLFREKPADSVWTPQEIAELRTKIWKYEAPTHAVNLGISCEACHLGSREHAEGRLGKPHFFPRSPHIHLQGKTESDFGRTSANVNWVCARCHTGNRRQLAAGMATWNSTEYTDAMRGSCYSQLTCVNCHDPHQATGPKWPHTPEHNDRLCLKCHTQFEASKARVAHTHHPVGSSGSRCMNCHMPRVNEGLQDVVRTHMIFSPTNREMIEQNQPNACNMCHVKESISWTQNYLQEWYAARYDSSAIVKNYPNQETSVALGWLKHPDQSVRLIGADSLVRAKAIWALPELIEALNDPYLLNRQFAQKGVQNLTGTSLDRYGYRYFMEAKEREKPLEAIHQDLLESQSP